MRANDIRLALDDLIKRAYAIAELAEELRHEIGHRTPQGGRGRVTSRPMTDGVRGEIVALRQALPDASQAEIARIVGVDSGRVSETLAGKRS